MTDSQGILEKRRAQAEVIKAIYETLKEEFGVDVAQRLIEVSIKRSAISEGHNFASKGAEPPSLASFASLRPLWMIGDALTVEEISSTETEYNYNVTRCKYAEMYKEMGLGEIGHLLSCNRDATFCEGYDPRIKLTRTQTIMQGAAHCDFRYRVED
jgi:L-2-amino-thiazoline-4-carboxylic acid hydrolase